MRKLQRGDRIKVKHPHSNLPAGTKGVVTGTFNGPYAQVNYPGVGGGPYYSPMPHIDGDDSGPEPGENDTGSSGGESPVGSVPDSSVQAPSNAADEGSLNAAAQRGAWEKLMGLLRS